VDFTSFWLLSAVLDLAVFFLGRYTAPNGITIRRREQIESRVLPFATLSDDRNDAYFADGVAGPDPDQSRQGFGFESDQSHECAANTKTGGRTQHDRNRAAAWVSAISWKARSNGARDRLRINAELIDARPTTLTFGAKPYDRTAARSVRDPKRACAIDRHAVEGETFRPKQKA